MLVYSHSAPFLMQEVFRRQVHPHGSLARQRASILMAEEAVEQALEDEKMRQRYTTMQ